MKKILAALKGAKPNRVAVYLTAIAGLVTAVAPAIANLDTTSTVGVISGFGGIVAVAVKYLHGWQAHEARQSVAPTPQGD